MMMDEQTKKDFIRYQRDEINGSAVYSYLSKHIKSKENQRILKEISQVEHSHYEHFKELTHVEIQPSKIKLLYYRFMVWIFGLTFALKIMEQGEHLASSTYKKYPEAEAFSKEEEEHENKLMGLINEKRLNYMGSVVLGLNDALVEFTGALAGFTLALSNTSLIALTASITAIAGALSMASSEYLSNKADKETSIHPFRAAVYTGMAFFGTVLALISPFIFISKPIAALVLTLIIAVLIIAFFNFYYAVVRGESFRKRFGEMATISFSIAGISFLLGYLLRMFTNVTA